MSMGKSWMIALAVCVCAGQAWAQPVDEEDDFHTPVDEEAPADFDDEPDAPQPPVEERRAPTSAPTREPAAANEAPTAPSLPESGGYRPIDFTIGLGFGYALPADIDRPNAAAVRFRLASGLTFEPRVILETQQQTTDNSVDETTDALNTIGLAAMVRYPLIQRGPFDFIVTGGAGLQFSMQDPDGDDNNSGYTSLGLTWGIAIDYWLSQHWCFSLTAINPLATYTSTTQEVGPDTETSDSHVSVGAIFDPNVVALMHLFY